MLWDGVKFEEGGTATDFEQNQLYTNYDYNERGLLSSLRHSLESYIYEFDELGKISKITAGSGDEASYTYDSLNQLTSESIIQGSTTTSVAYEYDNHGNMTKRAVTVMVDGVVSEAKEFIYTYDLDRLIQIEEKVDEVTVSTQVISYDGAGNLLNDGENSYTWEMGRQLQAITGADLTTSYKYNENGLRTEKTVNNMRHEYTYLGSSVTREVIRDSQGNILWTIHYSYAGDGSPVSMNVNGTEYYYLKNAQGDITHIVDGDGNEVASYEYDAWGNHLSITGGDIAELNPYRYRGYRYDSETGLYYLQSRYYDPELGRFVNSDVILGSEKLSNIYAYCSNNPIVFNDISGHIFATIGGLVTGAIVGGISAKAQGKSFWSGAISGGITGGVIGLAIDLAPATIVVGVAAAVGVVGGVLGNIAGQFVEHKINKTKFKINKSEVIISAVAGGLGGTLAGTAAPLLNSTIQNGGSLLADVYRLGFDELVGTLGNSLVHSTNIAATVDFGLGVLGSVAGEALQFAGNQLLTQPNVSSTNVNLSGGGSILGGVMHLQH